MNQYKILIVDDNKAVANSLSDSLEILGIYAPNIANNGIIALKKSKKEKFDAYLVDQRMPEMTGVEFIWKLLAIVEDPLVYVITAEDDGVALKAAEKSIDEGGLPIKRYVPKPWPKSLFSVDLREDLRERDLRGKLETSLKKYSSEQRTIQHQLAAAQDGLLESEKQNSAMAGAMTAVSGIKHEINNISAGITGKNQSLGYFLEDYGEEIKHLDELNEIHSRFTILGSRLQGCSDFIDIIVRKVKEPKIKKSLEQILNSGLAYLSVEELLGKQFMGTNIIKNYESGLSIPCSEKYLKVAFYQIFKNSIESMSDGGKLIISTYSNNSKAIIDIEDTGKGISKEIWSKIFIPFFTQEKIYGGKGGSIAHKIIKGDHEGDIKIIESYTDEMIASNKYPDKTQGTKIKITLPLNYDKNGK